MSRIQAGKKIFVDRYKEGSAFPQGTIYATITAVTEQPHEGNGWKHVFEWEIESHRGTAEIKAVEANVKQARGRIITRELKEEIAF